jgi:hypothetical protein
MQEGSCFMVLDANQEKIAIILFEYEETKRSLALKLAEAHRLGQMFSALGKALLEKPASVVFTGDSVPIQYGVGRQAFDPILFEGGKVKSLIKEIRELDTRINQLRQERASLGYPTGD